MSRVFFEAYTKATKELAAQEDRFPSLSEIDAMMESGAVYAFKDRIMKNTEFFEEIKISGVSYLVPKASRFIDESGTYTDLVLDFEQGIVTLPARKKVPAPSVSVTPEETLSTELGTGQLEEKELEIPKEEIDSATYLSSDLSEPLEEIDREQTLPEIEPKEIHSAKLEERSSLEGISAEPKPQEPLTEQRNTRKLAIFGIISIFIIIALGAMIIPSLKPVGTSFPINYDAYLSNDNNSEYLGLDIYNSEGILNDVQMALPTDIDKSISARGGIITISHAANTIVQLNSSNDAGVRVYLNGNWSSVPVNFSIKVPNGYESSMQVYGKDYDVKRKQNYLLIGFNLTQEGVRFEQNLVAK